MAMTEDLSAFFNTDEFAIAATLNGVAVRGIFDSAFDLASVGVYGMAGSAPVFTLASSDVPANPVGLSLLASAITYTVAAHEPDGTGISRLILERTA